MEDRDDLAEDELGEEEDEDERGVSPPPSKRMVPDREDVPLPSPIPTIATATAVVSQPTAVATTATGNTAEVPSIVAATNIKITSRGKILTLFSKKTSTL